MERRVGRLVALPGALDAEHAAAEPGDPVAAGRGRADAATAPPPRRPDVLLLALSRDGRPASAAQLDRLAQAAGTATDCFVFCPGWLDDEGEARVEAARLFALLDDALTPLRHRIMPLRVALHWPSRPFAEPGTARRAAGGRFWPEIERRAMVGAALNGAHRRGKHSALALLRDLGTAEVPRGPEEDAELEALASALAGAERAHLTSLFRALSFWVMKRRAGEVGERLGRQWLAPLWESLARPPRLHLVGHSFGARLLTSAVLGGVRPESLTLLLGAFSAFAFAPEIPRFHGPGFYCRILAERHVRGPIVALRSRQDTALATLYRVFSRSADGRRRGGASGPTRRSLTEPVATGALGAVGARGVGAPDLDLVDVQQTGIPAYPIVNVDGSRVVRDRAGLVGTHRDIQHPEIATLVAMAAGLLTGGSDGARPRPVDPRTDP